MSAWAVLGLGVSARAQLPVGTSFTYQGRLEDGGSAANGSYDFEFRLFAAAAGGTQVGGPVERPGIVVAAGLFTVELDFGDGAFSGDALWLEVAVRPAGSGTFTTLSPRQRASAAPYALHALSIPLAGSGVATTAARSDHDHSGTYALSGHDHLGQDWTTLNAQHGLAVTNNSPLLAGAGLRGVSGGTGGASYGVQGISLQPISESAGVFGLAAGSSGTTYGVIGMVGSPTGWGLFTPDNAGVVGNLRIGSSTAPLARLDVNGQGRFDAAAGIPPFVLPTSYVAGATVANLSADRLDGLDSTAFSTSVHTHDATDLASGTIASARVSGAYAGISGVGTLGSGTWNASPIGPLFGGTGQASWATGDLLFASAFNTLARLPVGTAGQVLSVASGAPTWADAGSHDHLGQTWITGEHLYALNLVNNAPTGISALRAARGGTSGAAGTAIAAVNAQPLLGATAIRGEAIDASVVNIGVYGSSSSGGGRGVVGIATATTGQPVGVFGQAVSPTGWGFFTANNSFVGGSLRVGLDGPPLARLDVVGQARVQAPSAAPPLVIPTAYAAGANVVNLSADRLDGLDSSDFASGNHDHVGEAWSVTSEPVGLSVTSTSTADGSALRGVHNGTGASSSAVEGINNQAGTGGIGVMGVTTASTGVTSGVRGRSQSSQGIGVRGEATSSTGSTWGVLGASDSSGGRGVMGWATAASGTTYGVYGTAESPAGYGLFTPDRAFVGDTLAVTGSSVLTGNVGVGGAATLARLSIVPSSMPGVRELEFSGAVPQSVEITANSPMLLGTASISDLALQTSNNTRVLISSTGQVGIGTTTTPTARLGVRQAALPVAQFDRATDDGAVILIAQDGVVEGSISVAGTNVSYNAFTGSHYAWTDAAIERGMLVSMTGNNLRLYGREGAEPIYGIVPSARANDAAVLGSYLGRLEPSASDRPATDNPHLVAAVGNGELWVVESGGDLEPGDPLVASATPGHAMRDDGRFEVSHVVARAAERVRWRDVVDRRDGTRRRLISVLFESHARESTSALRAALDRSAGELAELRRLVAAQSSRLEMLEAALRTGQERRAARSSVTGER
jgi:hypothetical protein